METLKVTKCILQGVALGQDSKGNAFYIMNGDLFLNETCEVELNEKSATLKELNYDIESLVKKHGDKDGLISTDKLNEVPHLSKHLDRIFQLEDKWCFPSYPTKKLIEIVISNDLWKATRISISKIRFKIIGRATVFGIDYKKAILKAAKEGISTTHLYWSEFKEWTHLGVFADFLIKLSMTKEGFIELNSWQAIGHEETLFFVHGILNKDLTYFTHIDFAYHYTNLDEIQRLLQNGKDKPILTSKKKVLRLDGKIKVDIGFELMSKFFPIDTLIDEYYHCT